MKIGTPLSDCATKALLLGSGELGKEIAIALQRYGVEVIAVDRYENAPAHQVAHRSYVIDMTDGEAIKSIVALEDPHYIIPELEAIATSALFEIEVEGKCTIVPNATATMLTMNREGIRVLAAEELKLPTSEYEFADSLAELQSAATRIGFPCIIKPTVSSSGKGQSVVESPDQLEAAWDYAKAKGRVDTGRVIIEAKIDFDFEITLLTVRALNAKNQVQTHFCAPIGHRQEHGDYRESWQPQALNKAAIAKAHFIATKITESIEGLGIFGVELFIKEDQVWFNEVSPRPHDTGMVTLITQRQNEFELHVRALLGLPVSTKLHSSGASSVILSPVEAGRVVYEELEQALAVPDTEIRLFGKPSAYVGRRMGVALATAATANEARIKAAIAANMIVIKPE
jgi:phosphoribosylglycinamide formyltransferase 2